MPEIRSSPQQDPRFFLPNLCSGWAVFMLILISELFVLVQVLIWTETKNIDWEHLATFSLFVQWVALTSSATVCTSRPWLQKQSPVAVTLSVLIIVTVITIIFTLVAQWFMNRPANQLFPDWHQLVRNALVALLLSAMLTRYFYIQHQFQKQQQAAHNARFEALQARIHPHFLFNSMNTIASLIHSDQEKAEQAVEDLSDLFRISLQDFNTVIPIEREIELCHRYLRIEEMRLGDRLNLQWDIAPLPDGISIPPLTLQPVIENAVYHGIQPLDKGGKIEIAIRLLDSQVILEVRNPMPEEKPIVSGHQLALDNIKSRLIMLYGATATIETAVHSKDGNRYFEARIAYPYKPGRAIGR